ncbi:MAG: hypothetical protein QM723_39530 [Myxococcaceae bacterium]
MALMRNVVRLLRNEKGAIDGETVGLSFGATSLGLGAVTYWFTNNLLLALGAAVVSFPLQLLGMTTKPTAHAVSVAGASVTGGALTLIVGGFVRVFMPLGLNWAAWVIGGLAGVGGFFWVRHRFNQVIAKLNAPPA